MTDRPRTTHLPMYAMNILNACKEMIEKYDHRVRGCQDTIVDHRVLAAEIDAVYSLLNNLFFHAYHSEGRVGAYDPLISEQMAILRALKERSLERMIYFKERAAGSPMETEEIIAFSGDYHVATSKNEETFPIDGAILFATETGIIAKFGAEFGTIQNGISATWEEVLEHLPVPVEEMKGRRER